jgi:general secretion pathway protein K
MASRYRGSALLSALFIMTLVAIAATAMSVRLQQDIHRTRLVFATDKLYLASQAVTFWAMGVLHKPVEKLRVHSFDYPKNKRHDYPDIETTGHLEDLEGRFNLNQLVTLKQQPSNPDETTKKKQANQAFFLSLLKNVLGDQPGNLQVIVAATDLWVNEKPTGEGEDPFSATYLQQNPPYFAGFQPMTSVSEFRLVQGVSEQIYQSLRPYLAALPPPTRININTASLPVLMSLGAGLSESEARSIINARGKKGFKDLNEAMPLLKELNILPEQITLESTYFLSIAKTRTHDQELLHYTLFKRFKNTRGEILVSILHDSLNDD